MSKNGITDSPVVYETDNLENVSDIKKNIQELELYITILVKYLRHF